MVFIEHPVFTRRIEKLGGADAFEVLMAIQNDLMGSPLRGRLVPGLSGVRKSRVGNPGRGKGKRGGFRYFYLYLEHRGHIHLLLLLDEQEDLTPPEREAVRRMVALIKEERPDAKA
ncbi:MAG TPA: hypothetical protein VGQ11_01715 [Candidatus Acidoferrales bacterium]|nr:hypothetical protein [Candidatus Acidoferrales bacterium]